MNRCPTLHELKKLLDGSMNDRALGATEAHVRGCASCQSSLSNLRDETDVAKWRERVKKSRHALEVEEQLYLEQSLEELKSNPPPHLQKLDSDETAEQIRFPGPPTTEAPLGQLAEYDILEVLGRGTFGTVFKAFDRGLERDVAIKVLNPQHEATQSDRKRFEQEARAVSRLGHDHIVRIYDVCERTEFPLPYFVMELIDGESLAEQLARQLTAGRGPFQPQQAAKIAWQVALALTAAHEHGLVHRDIKSSNIMLETSTGRAKVTDFGLAREMVASNEWSTLSGSIIGTLPYMSPEQVLSPDRVDTRSDLYSLGVVLYELLTGERPFRGTSAALLLQVAHDEPQPLRKLHSVIPRDLETICLKCLAKEPPQRYASATALADELQRYIAGEPIRARPVGAWERASKWAKRQPHVAALLAAVVVMTMLGFAGTVWQWGRAEARHQQARSAQRTAERVRDGERALREQVEKNLYFHRVGLAHREWLTNNLARADQLLDECPVQHRGWEWHHLRRQFHPEIRTLRGHTLTVRSVTCSPDSQLIASAGGDWNSRDPGNVIVWNADTGARLHTFSARSGAFHGVAFSPDSKRLATANAVEGITVWNLATGGAEVRLTGRGHYDVTFSPSGKLLAGAGADGTVRLWDAHTGKLQHGLTGHGGSVFCVAFCPDRAWLASTGSDGTSRIWNTETGQPVHVLEGTGGRCVMFSPDGMFLASCGYAAQYTGIVKIWETHNEWKEVLLQRVPTGPVTWLSFSPDGRFLALNNVRDGVVRVWDAKTGQERHVLRAHPVAEGVAFSPDGRTLVSSGSDKNVKLWDLTRQRPVITREDRAYVSSLAFSPNSARLALAGGLNIGSGRGVKTGQIWDVTTTTQCKLDRVLAGHNAWLTSIAYSADGKRLVSADHAGTIRIWDTSNGQGLLTFEGHKEGVTSVAFSPDGTQLASGGSETIVKVWDALTGELVQTLRGHQDSVNQVTYSLDGMLIASASEDHTAKLWDASTGRPLHTLHGHDEPVTGVAFDHDGRLLATCGRDGLVKLWEMMPRKQRLTITLRTGEGMRSSSPFRKRSEISKPEPRAITSPLRTLQSHTAAVTSMSFNSDDTRLASISDDGIVKLWDVATGQEAITLTPFGGGIAPFSVAFSTDGNLLAAARGHEVTLWDTSDRSRYDAAARSQVTRQRSIAWHESEAIACNNGKDWSGEIFHLSQLIALQPREPTHYYRRGHVYTRRNQSAADTPDQRDDALSDYEAAMELSGGLLFTGGVDHLTAPHIPFDQYNEFTIEAWFYGAFNGVIMAQGKSGDPENSIWLSSSTRRLGIVGTYGWESGRGTNHHQDASSQPLPLQWNHVALVYDGNTQRFFVNGKPVQQNQAPKPGPMDRERILMIGGHQSAGSKRFSAGLLRSIRISKVACYDSNFTPDVALEANDDTVLLFDLEKNKDWMTSLRVPDLSRSGNDGTLNGAWWTTGSKQTTRP